MTRLLFVAVLLAGCAVQTVVAPDNDADAANCGGKRVCACGGLVGRAVTTGVRGDQLAQQVRRQE